MKKPIPFGKYYLLERINVGGMAEVFRAKAFGVEGFERLVAVKRILPNIAEDKEFITMFVDEAKIAVQLNHANIGQIFDLGVVENAYYIALEHVWGRDLRLIFDRCRQRGEPMPVAQACFVIMKMCEGLDYAHNKRDAQGRDMNLVHRDVSPQNVLVSFEGEVKLIDFGIAKAAGKVGRTQQGILKGKFGYMSPEQVRGLPIDRRSDVFAAGIVLYEMLTGERLFVGESDFSTLEKVRNVEILPPSTYNRKIPDELERIVLKALAKDVDDRYQNAIDLHDELQAFVYTAGEFYSRKDLASWMKKTFVKEIQEETAKLETYRQLTPARLEDSNERAAASSRSSSQVPRNSGAHTVPANAPGRRTIQAAAPPPSASNSNGRSARSPSSSASASASASIGQLASSPSSSRQPPPMAAPPPQHVQARDLEWDDDELETQIYDTPGAAEAAAAEAAAVAAIKPAKSGPALKVVPRTSASLVAAPALYPEPDPELGVAATVRDQRSKHVAPPLKTAAHGSGPRGAPVDDTQAVRGTVIPNINVRKPPSPARIWIIAGVAAAAIGAIVIIFTTGGSKTEKPPATDVAAADKAAADLAKTDKPAAAPEPAVAAPQLPVDPNSGFDLTTDPAGAKVRLDGNEIGKAPLRVRSLLAGKHTLEMTSPTATAAVTKEIVVEQGKALALTFKLDEASVAASQAAAVAAVPVAPPAPITQLTVKFSSTPSGARVTLVGEGTKVPFGTTPFEAKIDPKKHFQALFELDGYTPQTKDIIATADGNVAVAVPLSREMVAGAPPRPVVTPAEVPAPTPPPAHKDPTPPRRHDPPHETVAVAAPREPRHEPKPTPSREPAPEPRSIGHSPEPRETGAPEAMPAPSGNGKLAIGAKPPCSVLVDGKDTGRLTPVRDLEVKAGTVTITLVNADYGIREKYTVTVRSGETTKLIKDFSDRIPQ